MDGQEFGRKNVIAHEALLSRCAWRYPTSSNGSARPQLKPTGNSDGSREVFGGIQLEPGRRKLQTPITLTFLHRMWRRCEWKQNPNWDWGYVIHMSKIAFYGFCRSLNYRNKIYVKITAASYRRWKRQPEFVAGQIHHWLIPCSVICPTSSSKRR